MDLVRILIYILHCSPVSTYSFPSNSALQWPSHSHCWFSATLSVSCFSNSDNLLAKHSFASGETPCLPIMDSSTASDSSLFSITAFPTSGIDPSLEKPIYSKKKRKKNVKIITYLSFLLTIGSLINIYLRGINNFRTNQEIKFDILDITTKTFL